MNNEKLKKSIDCFLEKSTSNAAYYNEIWEKRIERRRYYQSFDHEKILHMTEGEFFEYITKLWAMLIWGNKRYVFNKIIADNGFSSLKYKLAYLLYGDEPIEERWDNFLSDVKGFGPAMMSELLTYVNPEEYVIFNNTTKKSFAYLEIENIPKYNYQNTGKNYLEICQNAKQISAALKAAGAKEYDLLAVDYFFWDEVMPLYEKEEIIPERTEQTAQVSSADLKSLHTEIKDKIVAIGELLGFESRSEVKIADGAVVDAIWEAKIGNMGKAIYVFEVQSHGSIDSLILNLKKSQNNAAVQAVVAVADEA